MQKDETDFAHNWGASWFLFGSPRFHKMEDSHSRSQNSVCCATFVEHVLFHAHMDGDSGRRLGKIPHLLGSDGMELNTRVPEALTKVMENTSAPEMETVPQVIFTEVLD